MIICSELIVYCDCSLDSRELHLEDFSENTKKRRGLRNSFFADEISRSEYTKSLESIPEDPECSVCGYYTEKAYIFVTIVIHLFVRVAPNHQKKSYGIGSMHWK